MLILLFVTHTFTPEQRHLVRPLYFDYSQPHAEAYVNLLSAVPYTTYVHDLQDLRAPVRTSPVNGPFCGMTHEFLAEGKADPIIAGGVGGCNDCLGK